jgi:DNA-binding CsgD family transcriptional regulator/tetratricopeptide (TPR) repeat protein
MELLERKTYLDDLRGFLAQASRGHGCMLFLGGEAGVGKSALVREFTRLVGPQTRILIGACDPLSTPRPLGPLLDISEALGAEVTTLIRTSAPQFELFRSVLGELRESPPSLVVVEDAHWADEATLDLLRYLGRRVADVPTLIVVTYRNDEVGPGHSLRQVVGELASQSAVRRMALHPLSQAAVNQLAAGADLDTVELFRLTDGNPFFVTEVLSVGASGLPETVRDAVLARAARLSPDTRTVLDAGAVIGSPIDLWLLEALGFDANQISESIAGGMLCASGSTLAFRHDLARQAVLDAITPLARRELHRRVLAALRTRPSADAAQLAHHAEEADDGVAVLEYSIAAAVQAASAGAHRQAAAQYDRALRFASEQPAEFQADLYRRKAHECFLTGQALEALESGRREVAILRTLGDPRKLGDALSRESRSLWNLGRNQESAEILQAAFDLLESLEPGRELADAYSYRSGLYMLSWHGAEAIYWGERALEIAEPLGETEVIVRALNNVGAARTTLDATRGEAELRRSLAMAIEFGYEDHAARVYSNLGSSLCFRYEFADARTVVEEGLAFAAEHGLDDIHSYLLSWKAWVLKYQGHWAEATALAQDLLSDRSISLTRRIVALLVLGHIRLRQGDARAADLLDEALALSGPTAEPQRLAPVRAMRAEAAWLRGDLDQVREEVRSIYEQVEQTRVRWNIGELAYWLWRAGDLTTQPEYHFEPFELQIDGNWKAAAAAWRRLDCPYEAAVALADSDDEAALRYAFAEFARLGAQPMMATVTRKLRALGAAALPRGPRPATRENPFQLTNRELAVLELVVQRKRTQEISDALFLSPRTVGHHITAILAKLDVHNRDEAAWKAVELGIIAQPGHPPSPT